MSDPSRCWAPFPKRPCVELALVREFRYFYATLGPQGGTLDWMVSESMKTEEMSRFLGQVGAAHRDRHVIMVLDGGSSHKAKALLIPENVSLIHLPPYSPELNPVEILWHELREKHCTNRVFETLEAVENAISKGLATSSGDRAAVTRLSGWQRIINTIFLKAT